MKAAIRLIFLFLAIGYKLSAIGHQPQAVRHFNNEKLSKYLDDKQYKYDQDYTQAETLWDRIKEWFRSLFHFNTHVHSTKGSDTLGNIFMGFFIAGAVFVLIYFLTKNEKRNLFTSSNGGAIHYHELTEDIHQMDFDKLISDAVSKTQYRSAVRYLYLKTLKELSDKNLITWKTDKTNRDYSNELRPSSIGSQFNEITFLFDYSWYGNALLNDTSFNTIKDSFDKFFKTLK